MTGRRIFLALSFLWCLIVINVGYQTSPSIPLDLSPSDAATLSAFHSVLWKHRLFWGILGLLPFFLYLLINVFFKRS